MLKKLTTQKSRYLKLYSLTWVKKGKNSYFFLPDQILFLILLNDSGFMPK